MDEGVLEAARSVRPYLAELVGSRIADPLDTQLAGLLVCAVAGEDVEAELRDALEAHEPTSICLERVRDDAPRFRPPQVLSEIRSYSPLRGELLPVSADKFCCPQGDYVWYRMELGVPIEHCPTHHCLLEIV